MPPEPPEPRPPNAFILYKKETGFGSKMASTGWKLLTDAQKEPWISQAAKLFHEHRERNPHHPYYSQKIGRTSSPIPSLTPSRSDFSSNGAASSRDGQQGDGSASRDFSVYDSTMHTAMLHGRDTSPPSHHLMEQQLSSSGPVLQGHSSTHYQQPYSCEDNTHHVPGSDGLSTDSTTPSSESDLDWCSDMELCPTSATRSLQTYGQFLDFAQAHTVSSQNMAIFRDSLGFQAVSMSQQEIFYAGFVSTASKTLSEYPNLYCISDSFVVRVGSCDAILHTLGISLAGQADLHYAASFDLQPSPPLELSRDSLKDILFGYPIQALIPHFNDPRLRNAIWSLGRLSPISTGNFSTLRWLVVYYDHHGNSCLASGSPTYSLDAHHKVEAMFDFWDEQGCLEYEKVKCYSELMHCSMKESCAFWLEGMLVVLNKMTESHRIREIDEYHRYLSDSALIEQEAHRRASYTTYPLSDVTYLSLTQIAQQATRDIFRSLALSVALNDLDRSPTAAELECAHRLGECMAKWSLASSIVKIHPDTKMPFMTYYDEAFNAIRGRLSESGVMLPIVLPNYVPTKILTLIRDHCYR